MFVLFAITNLKIGHLY